MEYYGYQPEQTKAQIRSTRGETIDLALPITCLVGELRSFLIEEYGYDPNTRLLYNGLVSDDNSYVCDYPFGSLMIATPADVHQPRQSLPLRQSAAAHVPSQQQQQEPTPEPPRPTAHISPTASTSADVVRKKPAASMPTNTIAASRKMSLDEAPLEPAKPKRNSTTLKHRRKNSGPQLRSVSNDSAGSQSRPMKGDGVSDAAHSLPAPSPPQPPPQLAATNNGASPAPGSGRAPPGKGQRHSPWSQESQNASAAPCSTAPSQAADLPPSPCSAETNVPTAEVLSGEGGNDDDNQRRRVQLTVECHIPSLSQVVPVHMNGDSSVSDLIQAVVSAVPGLKSDVQVVHRGKALPVSPKAKLFDLGIRSDARVFIAEGEYNDTEKITLLEIEEEIVRIQQMMESPLTDLQRKGYYEELMRILFRADALQSLEGVWRQRRKDAVKHITSLQDALGVDVKES